MAVSTDTDKKLDDLIESINTLAYIIERRGRSGSDSGHFDDTYYYRGTRQTKDNDFLRNIGGFNSVDFFNLMDDAMKNLDKELESAVNLVEDINKQLENDSLTAAQRQKLNDDLNEAISKRTELQNAQNGTIREEFRRRQRIEEQRLREEYQSFIDEKKSIYGSEDNYVNLKIRQADFAGATANRNEASRMIAESGLGNTAVGRYAQTLIGRNQRVDNITNFGDTLQNGGAEQIAQALGGGKIMTGALKGFGSGLSSATKFLSPFAMGMQMAWDAAKMFGKVVGEANAYITHLIKMQTDINEMSFQKTVDINNLINERQVETAKYIGDLHLRQIEVEGQNLLQAVDIVTKQFVKATEIAVGPLTKGINESAYDAANAYLDYQAEQKKFGLEREKRAGELERFLTKRGIEYENFQNVSAKEQERIETKFNIDSALKLYEGAIGAHTNVIGRLADPLIKDTELDKAAQNKIKLPNGSYTSDAKDIVGNNKKLFDELSNVKIWATDKMLGMGQSEKAMSEAKFLTQPEMFGAEWAKSMEQWQVNLSNTVSGIQEQVGNKEIEIATEVAKKYIDATVEVQKMWLQLAQKTEQWLDKFDDVTNNLGISLGYTNRKQMDAFQQSMFEAGKVASKFGKSFEEVTKVQQTFVETTGRNRMMGEHDYGNLMGLGVYLGDDGLAASYASEMEIFNTGVADSVDMLGEALEDVNRMGLNGRKYTKTLVDNLKLAQKYNFKGGTQGLMNMAKWAENTRFNLASLGGMLDKVQEGGLENVITMGAQFQVLGGHAAMGADPIAMMYEAFADPEAYAKRMQDMTKGYGQVDKKTGETKFSGNEMMMMRQLAKIQGRSLEEVENEARARNKREVVAKQLNGNFTEEQQAFISNNATYDKNTGQFKVKVKRGNQYVDTDVSQLTEKDLENLMPEKHNERMEDYMSTVISYLAKMTGEENLQKTMMGQALWEDRKESYEERLQTAHENFVNMFETYVSNAREGMKLANEKFSDYIQMWQNNTEAQGPGLDQINAATSNIANALGNTATVIGEANQKIKESIEKAKFGSNGVTGKDETQGWGNIYRAGEKVQKPLIQQDGILSSNKGSMLTQADNVTKINDGLVQSHPKDVGLFAKMGGPFDKLFNGVFGKVSSIYNKITGRNSIKKTKAEGEDDIRTQIRKNKLARSGYEVMLEHEMRNQRMDDYMDDVLSELGGYYGSSARYGGNDSFSDVSNGSGGFGGSNNVHFDTLNVEINGTLELSSDGNSVNIMDELRNNPILLRSLSRMLTEHISSAMNGGRGISNFAIGSV